MAEDGGERSNAGKVFSLIWLLLRLRELVRFRGRGVAIMDCRSTGSSSGFMSWAVQPGKIGVIDGILRPMEA